MQNTNQTTADSAKATNDADAHDSYLIEYKGNQFFYCARPSQIRNIFTGCKIICTGTEAMSKFSRDA